MLHYIIYYLRELLRIKRIILLMCVSLNLPIRHILSLCYEKQNFIIIERATDFTTDTNYTSMHMLIFVQWP